MKLQFLTISLMGVGTNILRKGLIVWLAGWFSIVSPGLAFAQEVPPSETTSTAVETGPTDATGPDGPTGATEPTGAPACTGAGCTQGLDQGVDQGFDQGGTTLEQLGATQNESGEWVLPEGVENTTQGAQQGTANGTTATNSNTGADSANTAQVDASQNTTTTVSNTANDTTTASATANTGSNTSGANTGTGTVTTGDANIGVTQVKNDNTTAINGTVGLNTTGYDGDVNQDLELSFANAVSLLTGEGDSRSIQAINDNTGSGSSNDILLSTAYNELTEVQNDGEIHNQLGLNAITGQNDASMNTGNGEVATGDANIAATLVNLLNTTVINGAVTIDTYDIFGNLNGNIVIPSLSQLAAILGGGSTAIDASNDTTGSDSDNTVDIDINDTEQTNITNEAEIDTKVTANAITGQNDASKNTGGGEITTGDGSVQASNISVANTTVEGGNWALVIVNAFNRWVGFLLGDNGEVQQLSQDETIREIEARNSNTGSGSSNTIDIDETTTTTTNVDNDAKITNDIEANAITGQNTANKNTGAGIIGTGDANVTATAVNIANTVVKNATLGIAVINIFGDWVGDLMYEGNSLLAGWFGGSTSADIAGANTNTGSESNNGIDVTVNNNHETNIDNNADIDTVLNANIDTGSNTASKNSKGGKITTGDGDLALHSRAVANVTGVVGQGSLALTFTGENGTTGFDSNNKINAEINNERVLNINNDANVSTLFTSNANTGNNIASMNTGGAEILTGSIDATVAIHNLINKVIIAFGGAVDLGDAEVQVDAEMLNELTGALSTNENDLEVTRNFLLDIFNDATVDSLMDFLFNTGGNEADMNTGAVSIGTGSICVDGHVVNDVNAVSGKKGTTDATITNDADVTAVGNVDANTGDNQANMNTGGDTETQTEDCGKIARAPEEPPAPEEPKEEQPSGGGEGGGSTESEDLPIIARIAGAKEARAAMIQEEIIEPVKESAAGASRLADTGMPINRRVWLWTMFGLASALALAGAARKDYEQRVASYA